MQTRLPVIPPSRRSHTDLVDALRTALEQQVFDHLEVAVPCGPEQRRAAVAVDVRLRVPVFQLHDRPQRLEVALSGGDHPRMVEGGGAGRNRSESGRMVGGLRGVLAFSSRGLQKGGFRGQEGLQ